MVSAVFYTPTCTPRRKNADAVGQPKYLAETVAEPHDDKAAFWKRL